MLGPRPRNWTMIHNIPLCEEQEAVWGREEGGAGSRAASSSPPVTGTARYEWDPSPNYSPPRNNQHDYIFSICPPSLSWSL